MRRFLPVPVGFEQIATLRRRLIPWLLFGSVGVGSILIGGADRLKPHSPELKTRVRATTLYARANPSPSISRSSNATLTVTPDSATSIVWVDAATGNDANAGTFAAPFKTIKHALTVATDTIEVRPGTYNTGLGETFPITVPTGIKLQSTTGAATTIIDATGANSRVLYCNGNSNTTLVEGFTITGGFYQPPVDGSNATGGGILMDNTDQTTLSRCIITGNEARGYNGTGGGFFSGGIAYGGGIGINNAGTHSIVNCVFRNNIARGGNGFAPATIGYPGGDAHGGGIWDGAGTTTLTNNTFDGNQSIGGNGANAISGTSAGGAGGTALYGAADVMNATATNNIFANNSVTGGTGGSGFGGGAAGLNGSAISGGLLAASGSYNLFFSNTGGNGFTGTNAITGQNPLFINPPGDLHLRSSSPAKYAGNSTGAPTCGCDLDNNPRPFNPTIGAYELGLFPTVIGGIGRVTVTWSGVDGASSYNLYYAAGGTTLDTTAAKIVGATSPYVFAPVLNSSSWSFALTAVENAVEGPIGPTFNTSSAPVCGGPSGPFGTAATTGNSFTNITRDLANGNTLYATATDSVGLYKSTDAGDTWTALTGPFNGFGMHAAAANGTNVIVAGQGAIYRSTNGGSTWSTSVTGAGIGEDYVNSLAIDPLATSNVYAGDFHIDFGTTSTYLIAKSTTSGASFNNLTDVTSAALRAYYLQIDPSVSGTLYVAGSGTPNVAKSTNNGSTWTSVSPHAGYPSALALAPSSSATLYEGMRDVNNTTVLGVYKSTNSGTSWSPANGWPSTTPDIQALLVDPANANHVHAGTNSGYYVTTDGGTNWASGASGAGSFGINALVQTTSRRLIATSGATIIMLPLDPAPTISANASPSTGSSAGGDVVTVSGTGFNAASGLRVLFGGVDGVVDLGASTSTSITVTTPAHAVGSVDVAVINPDGQAAIRTNGYTFVLCSFSISPTSAGYSSAAATGSVTVTVNTGCAWTATAPGGSFVSVTSGSPGSGNGTVQYSVTTNGTGSGRSTNLTIAGLTFNVSQSAFGAGSFVMTAIASSGSVSISWVSVGGATSYQVQRSNGGGAFGTIMTTSSFAFVDSTVSNGTGYLYKIHANTGPDSNVDLAVPFAYTDPSLSVGSTIIKAVHFTELRTAVNAARAALGWSALTFADTSLTGVMVKRTHLIELRNAVDGVRAGVGLSGVSYTDSTVTAGSTPIRAAHINDLRNGLQ